MMRAKVHQRIINSGGRETVRRIVAACDADLLGKVYEEGEAVLDLIKYRDFYEGKELQEAELGKLLGDAGNINLVGKKTISAAGKYMKIDPKSIRKIAGVPHLQIYYV